MMRRKHVIWTLALLAGIARYAVAAASNDGSGDPPFPSSLEDARIEQNSMSQPVDNSLLIGNGDINALLLTRGRSLTMRITKNNVWDARCNTSEDPELFKVNIATRQTSGGSGLRGVSPSYGKPYPGPRACAALTFPPMPGLGWIPLAGNSKSTWEKQEELAVMSVEGKAESSAGYNYELPTITPGNYDTIAVQSSGTPNAMFDAQPALACAQAKETHWQAAAATEQVQTFAIQPGRKLDSLNLRLKTTDGKRAELRVRDIYLTGPKGKLNVDLRHPEGNVLLSRLDIRRAKAEITAPGEGGKTSVFRALAQRNVFLIDTESSCSLDALNLPRMSQGEKGTTDGVQWVRQQMPGDVDYPGMAFAVALAENANHKAVAVVTSFEAKDVVAEALHLAKTTLAENEQERVAEHERRWEQFWSASGVKLADKFFEALWYRNLYFMRCVSRPGVQAVGLHAGMLGNVMPWKGIYTMDYNVEQCFWGWYICNHTELAEPYERLIRSYLTRAKWFARKTWDCDGAFYPNNLEMMAELDPAQCKSKNNRAWGLLPWTYVPGLSGWAAQNLWMHYQYQPDRVYLESVAYPVLREVAVFYAEFLEKCKDDAAGNAVYGPSFSPEQGIWGIDNCPCDIAFTHLAFDAFIQSAGILGRDADLMARCQRQLKRVPDWPVSVKRQPPVVVDWQGGEPIGHNVAVPALPVYPAGVVNWFSAPAVRELFARTVEKVMWDGYNSVMIMSGARSRMSLPDTAAWIKTEFQKRIRPNGTLCLLFPWGPDKNGFYSEQMAASGIISELLLQSVGDVLRIFPTWPKEQDAEFVNLRAQGGFLVSASQAGGKITRLEIVSTVGGELRLLSPWPAIRVGDRKLTADERGIVKLSTQAGERLVFRAGM